MEKIVISPNKTNTVNVRKYKNSKQGGKANSKKPVPNPIQPMFKGKDVFIVGGGSSLIGFNFNLLKDKCVIAINRSFMHTPFAQILYFSDYRFYMWATGKLDNDVSLIESFKKFKGKVVSIANKINDERIHIMMNSGKTGFDTNNGKLKHGGNSGYAAINLAYHLGAKRIILMGYDMKGINGKLHFHDGYISKQNEKVYKRFIEPYKQMAQLLTNMGIQTYNTSIDSGLTYFKKVKIENFL